MSQLLTKFPLKFVDVVSAWNDIEDFDQEEEKDHRTFILKIFEECDLRLIIMADYVLTGRNK